MKIGNAIVMFIVCVVAGGFIGWGAAFMQGEGNTGQSKGTGKGVGYGAVAGVVAVGIYAVGSKKKGGGSNG